MYLDLLIVAASVLALRFTDAKQETDNSSPEALRAVTRQQTTSLTEIISKTWRNLSSFSMSLTTNASKDVPFNTKTEATFKSVLFHRWGELVWR